PMAQTGNRPPMSSKSKIMWWHIIGFSRMSRQSFAGYYKSTLMRPDTDDVLKIEEQFFGISTNL
ncbi:MAG TPA: hypothetical protein VNN13_08975, partial [Methylomirabilota bacterium]|nr:hypothetical protein [Methylomirabilota bacterium]